MELESLTQVIYKHNKDALQLMVRSLLPEAVLRMKSIFEFGFDPKNLNVIDKFIEKGR